MCALTGAIAVYSVSAGLGGFVINENSVVLNLQRIKLVLPSMYLLSLLFVALMHNGTKLIYRGCILVFPYLIFIQHFSLLSYSIVVCYFICVLILIFPGISVGRESLQYLFIIALLAVFGGDTIQDMLYSSIVGERDATDMDSKYDIWSINYTQRHHFPIFISSAIRIFGSGDGFDLMPPNAHIFILFRLTKWGILRCNTIFCLCIFNFQDCISRI